MRPQQQNRRMRGRGNNNNRKGPNPLTRSYESNGPDVKIRGTAQQVADKYTTLARDAHSSGDRVMAENYLQHAEHYNRIIAAAQAQAQQQSMRDPRDDNDRDVRDDNDEGNDDRDDRDDRFSDNTPEQPRQRSGDGSGPQPVIEGTPAEVALKDRESSRGNGARPNGRGRGRASTTGEGETIARAENTAAPEPDAGDEAAPKPAKRARRPRAKKAAEAGSEDAAAKKDASEANVNEEVIAQG